LSLNFCKALFAQEAGEVAIFLRTITHPSLVTPIRLSTDPTARLTTYPLTYGTVSRSTTFMPASTCLSPTSRTAPRRRTS
jgi:hypothetical protein